MQYEVDASGNAVYYHFDHVGNTAALTDESETVIDEFHYSPYGTVTYQKNSYETPFRFGGFFGIQTDSNGLVHMRARYYNPLIRRFINSDPARDAWNWFAYANGNPVSYVDPTGFAANLANGGGGNLESLGFNAGGLEHMAAEAEVFALKSLVTMANVIGAPWGAELPYPGEAIANIRRGYGVDPNSSSAQIIDETTDIAMIAGSAIVTRKGGGGKYGTTPKSRPLTKHYSTETGPKRNIPGSVVDNTIDTTRGVPVGGGKTVHYDSKNNVTVVTGDGGSIVSARKGPPRKGQE